MGTPSTLINQYYHFLQAHSATFWKDKGRMTEPLRAKQMIEMMDRAAGALSDLEEPAEKWLCQKMTPLAVQYGNN